MNQLHSLHPQLEAPTHPVGALLPRFTFITGPNGSGKTTLGQQLFLQVAGLQIFSFADPIRDGVAGMFHGGDPVFDLRNPAIKALPLPGFPACTYRQFLNDFGDWYRHYFGEDALGRFALNRVVTDADYFDQFVFDDARRMTDVKPIIDAFGADSCMLIYISRPGVTFDQPQHFQHDDLRGICRTIDIVNDTGLDGLLGKLHGTIELENHILNRKP